MRDPERPTLSSVDNALQVLQVLSIKPDLRVIDVANHLGVARSTAHRILSALVDRGFLVQDAHRIYRSGPAVEQLAHTGQTTHETAKNIVNTRLRAMVSRVHETCHVAVLAGTSAKFVDAVESKQQLHVPTRVGLLLPAHKTAIGVVLLAELPLSTLRSIYPRGLTGDSREARQTLQTLERKVTSARRLGYAVSQGQSDPSVCAIGMCLRTPHGRAFAGISISIPTLRFDETRQTELVEALADTVRVVASDLAAQEQPAS